MKAWIGDRKDAAQVRAARQHRLHGGRPGHRRQSPIDGTPGAITEAFIAGTQPGSGSDSLTLAGWAIDR